MIELIWTIAKCGEHKMVIAIRKMSLLMIIKQE